MAMALVHLSPPINGGHSCRYHRLDRQSRMPEKVCETKLEVLKALVARS